MDTNENGINSQISFDLKDVQNKKDLIGSIYKKSNNALLNESVVNIINILKDEKDDEIKRKEEKEKFNEIVANIYKKLEEERKKEEELKEKCKEIFNKIYNEPKKDNTISVNNFTLTSVEYDSQTNSELNDIKSKIESFETKIKLSTENSTKKTSIKSKEQPKIQSSTKLSSSTNSNIKNSFIFFKRKDLEEKERIELEKKQKAQEEEKERIESEKKQKAQEEEKQLKEKGKTYNNLNNDFGNQIDGVPSIMSWSN